MTAPEQRTFGDWRDQYVVCSHIRGEKPPEPGTTRHRGFRVCCEACYPGFLFHEAPDAIHHVWTETDDDVHRITSRICHECGKVEVVPYEGET